VNVYCLTGLLHDMSQQRDYDNCFYFAGVAIAFSGIIALPLKKVSDWEKKRNGISTSSNSSEDELKMKVGNIEIASM